MNPTASLEARPTVAPGPVGASERASAQSPSDSEAEALLRYTSLTPEALERATRIRARLEHPRPLSDVLVELKLLTVEEVERARRLRLARLAVVDILEEAEHLSAEGREAYDEARSRQPRPSDREVLVEGGLVREEHYLRALGLKLDVPFVEPRIGEIDTGLYRKLPFAYLLRHSVLPVREVDGLLEVIVATPEDEPLIIEVERSFGRRTRRFCATRARIAEALRTLERLKGKPADQDQYKVHYHVVERVDSSAGEGGHEAIQLVDYLLTRAIQMGASDLHIEPSLNRIRVRVRVDGVLHALTDVPVDFTPRLTARIKILAGLDVTEKRLHQDGKINVRADGRDVDIRVSTYVSAFGETIVMRFLDRDRGIVPLDRIGFQPVAFRALTEIVLPASSGLVLVVGPTGSGKTTTLYSFVDHANDPGQKVITCEDPVEYVIDGITQCSVNQKTGPTFADSLRAIVRQDPDTIVVGEIRDEATANLAIEAALTGHVVYSTFHTEEAVSAFVRLLEMGIEPFLVGSTVTGVIAQRLVRRLCPECRTPSRPTAAELRFLRLEREDLGGRDFHAARECPSCNGTGYRGRIALHEVLIPNDEFRRAVLDRATSDELRTIARGMPGFLTMMEDGVFKASQGITSLEEIIANAPRDPGARTLPEIENALKLRRK